MDLSIIIVNWNSTSFVLECVKSIYAQTRQTHFEIIVVDNCSPDGDVHRVSGEFPGVIVVKSPENLGFARANNLGFQRAKGEIVAFLNPDTLLENPAFDLMLSRFRSLASVGAVGCTLLNEDKSVQTSAIQTFPTILNQLLDIDSIRNRYPACPLWNIAPLFSGGEDPSPVEVISGACLLLRREVFAQVGMFSDDFFMYAEDLDLCCKVAQTGHMNYYLPQGRIIHYGGKSSDPTRSTLMKWKSILHYIAKHRGRIYLLFFRAAMASSALIRLALMILWSAARGKLNQQGSRYRILKWKQILKTMLTHSEPTQSAVSRAHCGQGSGDALTTTHKQAYLKRG